MDSRFVRFLLTSSIIGQIWSFPLGCSYNETVYKEEEIVKTNDPCLSCVCRGGSLMCNLLVCIDPPDNPSPGCFVVHKANECCPQVFCQDSYKQNIVEVRTPFKSENKTTKNECHVNGSTYAEGSAMTSSQLCEYCYCLGGEMKCIKPHCFFQIEGCKPVYQKSSCCPTYYDCRDVNVNISAILKKNSIKSYSKMLNNAMKYHRNVTADRKLLKVSRELIRSSGTSGYLGRSEHKTTLPASNNFTLAPEGKVNNEEEDLGKEKINMENSASFGSVMGTESEGLWEGTTEINNESKKDESLKSRNSHEFTEEENMDDSLTVSDEIFTNSSENNHDYDMYDYSDLKLPPSLPNLVIFPFVAADAVITNHDSVNVENREQNTIKRIDTDIFSSPINMQGGYQSNEFQIPDMIPIKNSDLNNDQVFRPPVSFADDSNMKPQLISPEVRKDSNSSKFLNDKRFADGSSIYFDSNFNKLGKTNRVSVISLMENPKPFDGNQEQTIKPLTVTYKNVVVDYYPEFLITSTRNSDKSKTDKITVSENHQKPLTVPESGFNFLPESVERNSNRFSESIQTKPAVDDFHSDSISDVMGMGSTPLEEKTLGLDTTTIKFTTTPQKPSVSTTTESSLVNGVVQSSSEGRVKSVTSRHKYSSKTKVQVTSTSKPTKGDVLEMSTTPSYNITPAYVKEEHGENIKNPISTSNTIESSVEENKDIQILNLKEDSGERNVENSAEDGLEGASFHLNGKNESLKQLQPNSGNFLKIAGCNIYGRMYRVGKIIPELSEPCLECVCTDLGVQCIPLNC